MKKRCLLLSVLLLLLSSCSVFDIGTEAERMALAAVRARNIKNLCALTEQDAQKIYDTQDSGTLLYLLYGLHASDCADFCVFLPRRALQVDEAAVFMFDDLKQLEKIKLAVSRRLSAQMEAFRDFDGLYARLADARYGQAGNCYYLIIAPGKSADAAEEKIREAR